MPSKNSFFNRGVAANLLRRFWPLWTVYLALLLLVLPQALANDIDTIRYMDYHAVSTARSLVFFSCVIGVAAAMAMFHYLYQAKSCSMMNALPVRREAMFLTAYLTGVVPLLLADLFVVLLSALVYSTRGFLHLTALGDVLLLLVFGNIAFYGFAVFCAMLTSNLLVLPAVYAVLLFTASVVEYTAKYVLSCFVFGMGLGGTEQLSFLSPPVKLAQTLRCLPSENTPDMGNLGFYILQGRGVIAAYAAAGILLSVFALFLYRRRKMETATDVVAITVLKPVFKYCLCFGTALVFATLIFSNFLDTRIFGRAAAGVVLMLMLTGGFIGYFAAEMLIQKTLKVFSGKWRGFFAACAAIILFVGLAEFDVFRYETRVPPEEDVKAVSIFAGGNCTADLVNAEGIAEAEDLHRAVIENKEACEKKFGTDFSIIYTLRNGKSIIRQYVLPQEGMFLPDSLQRKAEALLNKPSAVLARVTPSISLDRQNLRWASAHATVLYFNGIETELRDDHRDLTFDEAMSLYREGILPDARAGLIGRSHLVHDADYYENMYAGSIDFYLHDPESQYPTFLSVPIETASENTLRWLQEHTDLEFQTYTELGLDETSETYAVPYSVG